MKFLFYPFCLQGIIMLWDEFYYHHRRELPKWERIGHPLDTITVLTCAVFLLMKSYNETNLEIYFSLALFSTIFVTKDEWVHTEYCSGEENWLHALLFILHPISFISAGYLWMHESRHLFFLFWPLALFLFLIYQIFRWGIYADK
ncbi:MAG: hypothetical protein AB7I27_12090 [Bacteriovoracaceae bacterium]